MRFKKGSIVEVLKKSEIPSGSWWPAEIVSGNGHTYSVRYNQSPCSNGQVMERVPRKVIRPCPPLVKGEENWVPGDFVEVFDSKSWKIAKVLKVLHGGQFVFVRLLGSSQEFRVTVSDVRVRQSFVDNEWIRIAKDSRSDEDGTVNRSSMARCSEKLNNQEPQSDRKVKVCVGEEDLVRNNTNFQDLHNASSRNLKRGSQLGGSQIQTHLEACRKMRAVDKDGRCMRGAPEHPSSLLEKVDAVASPGSMLGDNYMHSSFNNKLTGSFRMGMESENPNMDERFLMTRSLEPGDAESSECSVASCSSSNHDPSVSPYQCVKDPSPDMASHFGGTESSSGYAYGNKFSFPTKEELAAEIHRLELHAYRSTVEALYASGPLSWEQEAMLTNLRLTLHISNDEHLLELKNLISSE